MNILVKPKSVFLNLAKFIIFLLIANVVGVIIKPYSGEYEAYGFIPMFNFDTEKNIPTIYSSLMLLVCSILLWFITIQHKRHGQSYLLWAGLSIIFLFLAIDEISAIHEHLTAPVSSTLNTSGFLFHAWVIPYSILMIVFAIVYVRFLFKLPKGTMLLFMIAGTMFVLAALGFELFEGYYDEKYGEGNHYSAVLYSIEELLEMFAVLTFCYALMKYITAQFQALNITVHSLATKEYKR